MDYGSAISKVIPGTFVPDLGNVVSPDERPSVGPIPAGEAPATSFKDTVKQMLADVNDKLTVSDHNARDLADGKTNDLQKVATSVEEANLALSFTMAVRTKLLEAYQQISQMQV
jgi:flagellar hook-basal body complex protein FliE